ncbi:MAG TPA: sulfotransferase [Acidobacteriota bacterium]|nr:sulfotransferase [Acidobacteriota bacterium]HNC43709.1 sulfotransferase [Acidobacteriota bacterium]HND17830.1 sulfotransferase [Acidobacteriota bacterium]HNG92080.1 sulfotransferase [Acidobacteriota bacterium]
MLPNLVIIGAMKCGTTSLHGYLSLHPQIFMSEQKELNFFIKSKGWANGLDWYEAQFPEPAEIRGESSPNYTKHPNFPGVPERMHQVIPDAKLVYIVRHPIERIVSHYIHQISAGLETRTMEAILEKLDHNPLINCTRYYWQLEQFLKYYPADQILIFDNQDLENQRVATVQRVFKFLGVDDTFTHTDFSFKLHQSKHKRKPSFVSQVVLRMFPRTSPRRRRLLHLFGQELERPAMSEATKHRIMEYLHPDIEQLKAFTGLKFEDWKI